MKIDQAKCIGCGTCAAECFYNRIVMENHKAKLLDFSCWNCEHCVGICPVGAITEDAETMKQVVEYDEKTFHVEPQNLLNLIKLRRSMRMYKDEPVDEETLLHLLEAGRYSPNGSNRQILRYIILKDTLPQIRDAAIEAFYAVLQRNDPEEINRVYAGNIGYNDFWKTAYPAYKEQGVDSLFYNAPAVILAVAPRDDLSMMDAGIATSNISLLAEASGLGTCYIAFLQMACEAGPNILKQMGIADDESLLAVLAIGKPAIRYHRTVPRKELRVDIR